MRRLPSPFVYTPTGPPQVVVRRSPVPAYSTPSRTFLSRDTHNAMPDQGPFGMQVVTVTLSELQQVGRQMLRSPDLTRVD
jgi:hypothetical protein